jgi:hypothetical protein
MTRKPVSARPRKPAPTTPQDGPPPPVDQSQSSPLAKTRSCPLSVVPPLVRRSQQAFRRALPQLLRQPRYYRQWVAYHGETCLGFAASETELYQECRRQGLADDAFVVRCIVPEVPAELDVTPLSDV